MTAEGVIEQAHRSAGGTWWAGADDHAAVARHILNTLKSRGYAVVEIPEPDSSGDGLTQATWQVGNLTIDTMGSSVLWPTGYTKTPEVDTHNGCQPDWARKLAAALLAAADAAERVS